MKDDIVYLKHISEAVNDIEQYVSGFNFESFILDKKTADAVLRKLEVIGEAANNLSESFRNIHPEVPFRNMVDMRNIVIHEYFGVDLKTVWDTCHEDLPKLKVIVEDILK